MTIWHHKHNILLIIICFYHPGAPLQTRGLSSRHCKNSLEMCLERLRWVSGYVLALIAEEHTVKHLNHLFTDVQLDAREQNWSPRFKIFAAALQWRKVLPSITHMADPLADHQLLPPYLAEEQVSAASPASSSLSVFHVYLSSTDGEGCGSQRTKVPRESCPLPVHRWSTSDAL